MRAFKKVGLSRAIPAGGVVRGDKRKGLDVARVHTDRDSCEGGGICMGAKLGRAERRGEVGLDVAW